MASSPERPEKTAEQVAIERRQSMLLDEEIEETEERLRSLARGTLGRQSLLSGSPATREAAAGKGKRGAGASILDVAGGRAPSVGGGGGTTSQAPTVSRNNSIQR